MKRLSIVALVFSIAFLVFFLGPPFLSMEFGPYPLMRVGDVFDLLTPLVLIPLYLCLYRLGEGRPVSLKGGIFFVAFAALWVLGQGMHLAANSIGHLLENMRGIDALTLTGFYDEVLSHYLWHFGIFALSALVIYRHWRAPVAPDRSMPWAPVIAAGVIYGFAYFAAVIEGATTPAGVPFAGIAAVFLLVWGRKSLAREPVLAFFLVAYVLAAVLFLGWGIYWRGLPEFSDVGIID